MWKDRILIWEETPHVWNNFGIETSSNVKDDDLYARGIVIWKKTTLGEFIDKTVSAFDSASECINDQSILTGFMLVITAANLFPFHIKVVKDDEVAEKFLSILRKNNIEQYILKKDLKESEFGHLKSLGLLVSDLVKKGILIDSENRFIVNGKVLNNAHILDED